MRRALLGLVLAGLASTAAAQTKPVAAPPPGSASVKTQLQALHYKDVKDLRRGPDGQWTGTVTRNGITSQVTVAPTGTVTAR